MNKNNNFTTIGAMQFDVDTAKIDKAVNDGKLQFLRNAQKHPELVYGLGGALSGAGIGGLASFLMGDKSKSKLRKILEGTLIGGVTGGLAGAGTGYLTKRDKLKSLLFPQNKK